jgi:transcriptional regulator with XRE-family HTH domain
MVLDFEQLRQEIGINIKTQRKNANRTQQELAEKVDKSRFWLTAIETGYNLPTIESLYQLAVVLHCSISDFLPPKIHEKAVSVTGPDDLINSPAQEQIISMLEGVKNGKI